MFLDCMSLVWATYPQQLLGQSIFNAKLLDQWGTFQILLFFIHLIKTIKVFQDFDSFFSKDFVDILRRDIEARTGPREQPWANPSLFQKKSRPPFDIRFQFVNTI